MSRHHLRGDKTCLNCGFVVEERYCSRCGQQNIEPKESFLHLVGHFFADITHFDSQIFTTLKDLVLRPGFLTREYIAGKRVRYLNPIRMYVFISAVFFLVMFAGKEEHNTVSEDNQHPTNLFRQQLADSLRAAADERGRVRGNIESGVPAGGNAGGSDSVRRNVADSVRKAVNGALANRLDTTEGVAPGEESLHVSFGGSEIIIDLVENKFRNVREFDSVEKALPDSARDKGFMHWLLRKNVRLKEEHGGHRSHIRIEENLQHTIPKIMFILLPLFALITGWFYSRKKYLYVQHAVFSIHFHSFVFLFLLLVWLLSKLITNDWVDIGVTVFAMLLVFVYLVAALKGMYRQSVWLSLLKGLAISLLYWVLIIGVLALVMVITFMRA